MIEWIDARYATLPLNEILLMYDVLSEHPSLGYFHEVDDDIETVIICIPGTIETDYLVTHFARIDNVPSPTDYEFNDLDL